MTILVQIVSILLCVESVFLLPIQEGEAFGDSYGMKLAKRPFYPYREAILSPFGLFDTPRETSQGQRKKAVDSTFIRFGRNSPSDNRNIRDLHSSATMDEPKLVENELPDNSASDSDGFRVSAQRFLLNHNGCRVSNTQELMKALLSDPNCIKAFQKVRRENVNDTFMGFGKREAPSSESKSNSSRNSSLIRER